MKYLLFSRNGLIGELHRRSDMEVRAYAAEHPKISRVETEARRVVYRWVPELPDIDIVDCMDRP